MVESPVMDEFVSLDATEQAELVRRGEVQSIELVDAAIKRIEALNPKLNAVITPLYDLAREAARQRIPEGLFSGVPFLVKDLLAFYQGVPMNAGTRFLKDFIPDHDSELIQRIKNAGLITLGKTNTPELGLQPTTEPLLSGPTHNPWDLGRTAGGSSGGSAAAVAAGLVPMAHGNDGGGSIRIPASCCGVFGLKPTRGRTTLGPDYGDILSGLVVEHALTRSVRDSAALLDATHGPGTGDPYVAPSPKNPFRVEAKTPPGKLRIAFTTKAPTGVEIHADCIAAVKDSVKLLTDLGHEVEEKDLEIDSELFAKAFMVVWTSGAASAMEYLADQLKRPVTPEEFEPLTWALRELGLQQTALAYLHAIQSFQSISRGVARQFEDYEIWLTPTLGLPPVPLGTLDSPPEDPLRGFFAASDFVPFTPLCNVTGQPAMSVPLYWNSEGLPIGSHFIGHFGDEGALFRLAGQLEEARPWAKRFPPISAFFNSP